MTSFRMPGGHSSSVCYILFESEASYTDELGVFMYLSLVSFSIVGFKGTAHFELLFMLMQ